MVCQCEKRIMSYKYFLRKTISSVVQTQMRKMSMLYVYDTQELNKSSYMSYQGKFIIIHLFELIIEYAIQKKCRLRFSGMLDLIFYPYQLNFVQTQSRILKELKDFFVPNSIWFYKHLINVKTLSFETLFQVYLILPHRNSY